MNKKNYVLPNIEVINIDTTDIITTSSEYGDNNAPGKMPDIVPGNPFWD